MASSLSAVIFDYGGVFSVSPFGKAAQAERAMGLADGALSELLGYGMHMPEADPAEAVTNRWHLLELGRIEFGEYAEWVADRSVPVFGRRVEIGELISAGFGGLGTYWPMVHEARRLAGRGCRLAICTNNIAVYRDFWKAQIPIELFDVVIDSSEVGLRKPFPEIYELTASRLGVACSEAVFIDDHPGNVAGAAATGMTALHVVDDDIMTTIATLRSLLP